MDNGIPGILYMKTPSGIAKILQIIFALCGLISSFAQTNCWSTVNCVFYGVACAFSIIYSLFILLGSIANLQTTSLSWHKFDLLTNIIFIILIFTSTSFITPPPPVKHFDALKAAAVFGYLNGFSYFGIVTLKIIKS